MTGANVYNSALDLLGYTDTEALKTRAIAIINQTYLDMHEIINGCGAEFEPIKSLSEKIKLSDRVIRKAMLYGVAEQLALGEGDGELQQYFAIKYDTNRRSLNNAARIKDILP